MPPWKNPWLILGVMVPLFMHLLLIYVPALASIFGLVPLTLKDWKMVLMFAAPILLLEEFLKAFARYRAKKLDGNIQSNII